MKREKKKQSKKKKMKKSMKKEKKIMKLKVSWKRGIWFNLSAFP